MKSITAKQAKEFGKIFAAKRDFRVISKGQVMWVFQRLARRVMTKYAHFVEKMSDKLRPMTIYKLVFLPWKMGAKSPSALQQVLTMVHEAVHVVRIKKWREDGGTVARWYKEYYTNPTFRATEEALCIAAEGILVTEHLGGDFNFPDLRSGYYFGKSDQAHAEKIYNKYVSGAGVSSDVVRTALGCLKDIGVL